MRHNTDQSKMFSVILVSVTCHHKLVGPWTNKRTDLHLCNIILNSLPPSTEGHGIHFKLIKNVTTYLH